MLQEWFASRIPKHWEAVGLEVLADQDEILVVVDLADSPAHTPALRLFRERTRDDRMVIAREAEAAFGRRISWGVRVGGETLLFTTTSVPVMTRLRLTERMVLDTLIDAGVARTRSEALSWCVRLVGENEQEWIAELRKSFEQVEAVRDRGPKSRRPKEGA